MTDTGGTADAAALRAAAHEHADHLHRRVRAVAADLARTEESLARACEVSASVRPHAAERLRDMARRARRVAEDRRRYAYRPDHSGGTSRGRQTGAS